MPQPVIAGYFDYPNLSPLIAGEYTCSHGTAPGTIVLRVHPAKNPPTQFGDIRIGDGRKELRLRACKLLRLTAERDDGGQEWSIEIEDTRWQWRGGRIDGMYNQLDPHGKLIPKMVRSPTELANLCLDQMQGFRRRFVDMPDGIDSKFALTQLPDFLPVGVNFPQIGINPPVNWYAENPAAALAALADLCGRRIVFDPVNERVLVVRVGIGRDLPDGHIANFTPSLTAPETPDAVEIVGDPTRYETMFELQAVGLEWDGSIRPINELSYAPQVGGRSHEIRYAPMQVVAGAVYGMRIEIPGGKSFQVRVVAEPADTLETISNAIKDLLEAEPLIAGKVDVVVTDDVGLLYCVFVSGLDNGYVFDAVVLDPKGNDVVTVTQAGVKDTGSWDFSPPPLYPNVKATNRLTRLQAVQLAQRSVWRMYRITGRDASTLKAPIQVPKYGPVVRQDIVLLDEQCEQVVPEAGDKRVVDRDGVPLIKNLYDGYSRSKPAEVYGSVCSSCINNGEHWFIGDGLANAGAAAIGGAAIAAAPAPVPRVVVITVTGATVFESEYRVSFEFPTAGAPLRVDAFIDSIAGDTEEDIAAALRTDIVNTANIGDKVTASLEGAKIIVEAKDAATLFSVVSKKNPVFLTTEIIETGSGAAPLPPPAPNSPPVSPSQQMTPVGVGKGSSINTDPSDRVYVDFSVDATWQMITFSSPVWFAGQGMTCKEPKLFLRAACHVRNGITQQLEAYSDKKVFRKGLNVLIAKRPDVQLNIVGDYRIAQKKPEPGAPDGAVQYVWNLINTRLLEQDAVVRARYYLNAEILQFQVKGGVTIDYNGIEPITMDGKTQQVSYKVVGGVGTMTTASSNMEHSTWLPPYPARRRAENLAAVGRAGGAGGGGRADNPATGSRNAPPPGAS